MTTARMMRAATRSAFLFAAVAGCSEIVEFKGLGSGANTPTVGLNPGQFIFAVTARHWTFDNTYSPNLGAATINVAMAITYSDGDGLVTITDADNAVVFNQTLAGDVATGTNITVSGKQPFKVRIVANDYTGVFTLDVNAVAGS